ncbi:Crp/Fnr family transcriptional regulator [Sphingomonas sp. MG17]|uniref:Crp/Fnr family transcriptional regulator n=1 Tax=Sphingomonas tagetis TaxID=2949092 RepID=A0A9X2HSD1_9SPHN|nr:Crp/Fnr family transcriptional regulator [Sphingomonas tagetis]MCP3732709.1 Crp/Fnr family transcriptional regulator [Sphingomonas tagetis]
MTASSTAALQLFVDRLTARSILTDEEQGAILALPSHRVEFRRKQDFVHIDEVTSYACLIASGVVGRFGQTATGARQTTAFHIAGDMVDLHSTVRPVGIGGLNALCEATILRVPHAAIREVAARYPAIAEAFWRDCMLDAAVLMQWVVNVGRRDARTRIAHVLCEMAIRIGEDRQILVEYDLPITQEQLGDAAALTSVHVNRSLKTLTDLVTIRHGRVRIRDWHALADVGEFEGSYLTADTAPDRQRRYLERP